MVEGEDKLRPTMSALAILSCRPNSHPFQERHISLHEAIKIGRSVARARPAANNGIFDCKVLSRHHALLFYENGKFYLQDTKSSNGTFINNQRLCKGGEESPPREIFSGDLIQFGVEVMENNRRGEKITHGCIVATIVLYHPDGREATPAPFLNAPCPPGITIQSQDLYQLAQYLQEALHREKMLEQKLSTLQQLVASTQDSSESGWQALIDEDKLLSRLEVLETQLHTYSKNHSEDTLRQELDALQEEKLNYETTAKESLRRVLQEKLEAVTKLSDLERSLSNTESECGHLKDMCEKSQDELKQLAEKYQDQLKEVQELQDKLKDAEEKHKEECERSEQEKQELTAKIEEMMTQESILSAKVESLQADNDFAKEQLAAMKAKFESIKEINEDDHEKIVAELDSIGSPQADIIPLSPKDDSGPENLPEKLRETQQQLEKYKAQLEENDVKLKESSDKVEQLAKELEMAKLDSKQYLAKMASLEEKLKLSDTHMNQMMENALADLKLQLKESRQQCDSSNSLIQSLEAQIEQLESELTVYKLPLSEKAETTLLAHADNVDDDDDTTINGVHNHLSSSSSLSSSVSDLSDDDDWKALLEEAREAQRRAELELRKTRDELELSKARVKKNSDETLAVKGQLLEAQRQAKDSQDTVTDLQDQLRKAETATKDVKQQILDLRDRLLDEQELTRSNHVEADNLKQNLESERGSHKETKTGLHSTKRQLQEAQQNAKQSHNEAEQLRNKLKHLQEELETEKKDKRDSHGSKNTRSDSFSSRQSARTRAEFMALKEECANLRKRIQAIEAEMKMSRRENLQLSSEYNKLQESYKNLEALKEKLESSESAYRLNLTDAQKDAEQSKQEVRPGVTTAAAAVAVTASSTATTCTPHVNGTQLRTKCDEYVAEIDHLKKEMDGVLDDYRQLADKSKVLSFCSSIPLLMLLFAFLVALYPTLAELTATTS
ncbi:sarcolemmal membrane-associated protein-like isoform X3 [Haliotis rufescens]|uniref:sarcolemmal membrane-associated protein-like isoform X3 n=1 Tax=Haliotis rufescens TaxID=6454 RepID=UPI001EB05196|nr:sarcolemmal membrane-associated protein-like isoform X3 [Haliotis rufescens]